MTDIKESTRTVTAVTDLRPGDRVQGRGTVESTRRITDMRLSVYWEEGGFTNYPTGNRYRPGVVVIA